MSQGLTLRKTTLTQYPKGGYGAYLQVLIFVLVALVLFAGQAVAAANKCQGGHQSAGSQFGYRHQKSLLRPRAVWTGALVCHRVCNRRSKRRWTNHPRRQRPRWTALAPEVPQVRRGGRSRSRATTSHVSSKTNLSSKIHRERSRSSVVPMPKDALAQYSKNSENSCNNLDPKLLQNIKGQLLTSDLERTIISASGAAILRLIVPGVPASAETRTDRINVQLDNAKTKMVLAVWCG
jgi:hypothetical protein